MIKYKSNTYYLIDDLFFMILYAGISCFLTYFFRNKVYLFFCGLIISLLLLFLFFTKLNKLAKVEFYENKISIKHLFPKRVKHIEYSVIKEYQHIQRFNYVSLNAIKYLDSETSDLKQFNITTVVPNKEYIEFIKWIKPRNNDIKFTFLPPDINLLKEYKKEFG